MRARPLGYGLLAIGLAACSHGEMPMTSAAAVVAPVSSPAATTAPVVAAAPVRIDALAGEALARMLACRDRAFLTMTLVQQQTLLQADPRVNCHNLLGSGDAMTLECAPSEPLSAFGLHVFDFKLSHRGQGHNLFVRLQGDTSALLDGIAGDHPRPTRTAQAGRVVSMSNDDGFALKVIERTQPGEVGYECRVAAPGENLFAMPASAAPAATTPTETQPPMAADSASLSGAIEFPGESIPALRVCAIAVADPAHHGCVDTQRDQAHYRIDNLPAGDYQVWAWLRVPEGDIRMMRAVQQVQCIRAPCLPQPITITLAEGANIERVTLNDYAESYPDQPKQP